MQEHDAEGFVVTELSPEAAKVPAAFVRSLGKLGLSLAEQALVLAYSAIPQSGVPDDWHEPERLAGRLGVTQEEVLGLIQGLRTKGCWNGTSGFAALNPLFARLTEVSDED